ncbi:MAG: glycosyltransferase, partial [Elstera sp.]
MTHLWDLVPFESFDTDGWMQTFLPQIERVRNAFWYCHALEKSNVRMIEADPYNLPPEIGDYDIGVLASVLLHCRAPFSLLEQVARRVTQTIIVTDEYNPALGPEPVMRLLPHRGVPHIHTWWQFNPQFFVSALGLLGFTEVRVGLHKQQQVEFGLSVPMFTVVASRPAHPLPRVYVPAQIDVAIGLVLTGDFPLSDSDRRLLRAITTRNVSAEVPLPHLPSYALRKALASFAEATAERLFGLVATAPATEALALLSAALAFHPDHIPARLALAWRLFDDGEPAAPCQHAAHAYERAPEQAAAAYGWFLIAAGELKAAEAILRPALAAYPAQAPLHWYMGVLLQRLGDLTEAAAALRTAHELDPSLPDVPFVLAWVLHDLGAIAEAQAWNAKALAIQLDADRLLQAGWLALCQQQYEIAEAHYRAAAARVPLDDPRRGTLETHWAEAERSARVGGRHVLVLSPQALIEPGALAAASARLNGDPSIGVVGGRIMDPDGKLWEAGGILYRDGSSEAYGRAQDPEAAEYRFSRDVDYSSGGFLTVRRALWDMLGGFDPAVGEGADIDFCLRVWRAGFRVVYEPNARVTLLKEGAEQSGPRPHLLENYPELTDRRPRSEAQPLIDRWRPSAYPRVLLLESKPPLGEDAESARTRHLLQACDGFPLSLLWSGAGAEADPALPASVEVICGVSLEAFLAARRGVYTLLLIRRKGALEAVEAL